jgi:hypothetical protein
MSKSLLTLNLVLAAATVLFSVQLVRLLLAPHPLPAPPIPRPVQAVVSPTGDPAPARPPLTSYSVVATRNLFNPNRSEAVSQTAPPGAKPILYGVVINGDTRLAYLEDPVTKRVVGYKIGDALAGGQLERIEVDRVIIKGSAGPLELALHDPNKPKPAVSSPTAPQTVSPAPVPTMRPSAPEVPQGGGGAFR